MKSIVVTTTGIVAVKVTDSVIKALATSNLVELPSEPDSKAKKALKVGRYFVAVDGALKVFSVDEVDLEKAYNDLDDKGRMKYFADGFKRQEVNRGNHEAVKSALGLAEPSNKAKTIVDDQTKSLNLAIASGLKDIGQLQRIFPALPEDMIKAALKSK